MGNFAVKVENHGIILSSDALQPLIKCLQAEDLETRFYAAYCLGKIAQASHHHGRIGNAGAIKPLIELMYSEDTHAKCQAICTMRRSACTDIIATSGFKPPAFVI